MGVGATAGIKHLEPGESMQIGAVLAYEIHLTALFLAIIVR